MNKGILIYNPLSHGGRYCEEAVRCATEAYAAHGISLLLHPIDPSIGGFGNLKTEIEEEKPDHIVIAGGDGTLSRYLTFSIQSDISLPIGIIPAGTANDYAGSIGIDSDIKKAVLQIIGGKPLQYDACSINKGYFLNVFSSGYLTCVSHTTSDWLKRHFGRLAYFIHGTAEAIRPRRRRMEVTCDGKSFSGKALLILVLNGKTAGGMSFAREAEVSDGMLDIRIFTGKSPLGTLAAAARVLLGLGLRTTGDIICLKGKNITIDADRHETDIDGDSGPSYPVKIECMKGILQVIR